MAMTDYLRKKLGDHAIGKAAFTMPTVYLGLFTASPTVSGLFTNEVGGGVAYSRIELTSKLGAFDLSTGIAVSTADVNFATPTGNWGTITYLGVIDQASGASPDVSHILFFDPMPVPALIINNGRALQFLAGSISISL